MKKIKNIAACMTLMVMLATATLAKDGIIITNLKGDGTTKTGQCTESSPKVESGIIITNIVGIIITNFMGIIITNVADTPVECGIIITN